MPIERFRSGEEMNASPARAAHQERSDEENYQRFVRHCARMRRLSKAVYPRGVYKFRTVEEAQAFSRTAHRFGAQEREQPGEGD
ncbi:MAG: hypothetical protein DWQ36_20495 [Acidobacteria bacterium]|nr:MAG: hypothetical protein DWQ30_20920 [Acidobacteriota bacterium]REK03250.1 MAG: hypothetical protein DWQ36_20495 [Acidobacteriota bacterium]